MEKSTLDFFSCFSVDIMEYSLSFYTLLLQVSLGVLLLVDTVFGHVSMIGRMQVGKTRR